MRLIRGDMNKHNLTRQTYPTDAQPVVSTFQPLPVTTTLGTDRRLIVLVPADIDCGATVRRIWELANAGSMHIQLLGLCEDPAEEPALRRRLIGMASLLQDGSISAEAKVAIGTNWMAVVKSNYKPGDAIVCFAEQRTGLLNRPLNQVLESNFNATVYIFSTLAPQRVKSNALSQVGAWLGFIAIILGFGILQANIVQLPKGWLQSFLLVFSIIPEFWLISVWHTHFR